MSQPNKTQEFARQREKEREQERKGKAPAKTITPEVYSKIGTAVAFVLSIIVSVVAAIIAIVFLVLFVTLGRAALLVFLIIFAVILILGLIGAGKAGSRFFLVGTCKRYARYIKDRTLVELRELSEGLGKSLTDVKKDIQRMLKAGMIPQGRLDEKQEVLLLTEDAYRTHFDQMQTKQKKEESEKKREQALPADVKALLRQGEGYIAQLDDCKKQIKSSETRGKLDRMADVSVRILDQLKKTPSSASDLRRFMDYYMPTILRLLHTYIELESAGGKAQESDTGREIADTLDKANEAFERLLSNMVRDQSWDVQSDIAAMNTMFAQDGLSGGNDFSK